MAVGRLIIFNLAKDRMIDYVKIPERRRGVLIGKEGYIKSDIERKTLTKLEISEDVRIEGEAVNVMKAKEIVTAIGRGFSPEKALELLREGNRLVVIKVEGSEKTVKRILSRVIGRKGYCRRRIEEETGTCISVYGKTVSIIGSWDAGERTERALQMLIDGKPHSYVYRILEGRR